MGDSRSSSGGTAQAAASGRIPALGGDYELRTGAAVGEYLRARSELSGLLRRLPEQARRYFGGEVRLALEVCPDREGSGPPELYAHIITALPVDDAWDKMLALEEGWWLDAAGEEPVTLHVELA